jgi:hypothetical protein
VITAIGVYAITLVAQIKVAFRLWIAGLSCARLRRHRVITPLRHYCGIPTSEPEFSLGIHGTVVGNVGV